MKQNGYKFNFQCSDVGYENECDWQISGTSEEEIMPKIEQHGRERHNLTRSFDESASKRVREVIRRRAA